MTDAAVAVEIRIPVVLCSCLGLDYGMGFFAVKIEKCFQAGVELKHPTQDQSVVSIQ